MKYWELDSNLAFGGDTIQSIKAPKVGYAACREQTGGTGKWGGTVRRWVESHTQAPVSRPLGRVFSCLSAIQTHLKHRRHSIILVSVC